MVWLLMVNEVFHGPTLNHWTYQHSSYPQKHRNLGQDRCIFEVTVITCSVLPKLSNLSASGQILIVISALSCFSIAGCFFWLLVLRVHKAVTVTVNK